MRISLETIRRNGRWYATFCCGSLGGTTLVGQRSADRAVMAAAKIVSDYLALLGTEAQHKAKAKAASA